MISFHGAAKKLDDIDLPKIAHTIGCGEDELHAVIDTETAGTGFQSDGRLTMLYEPHVFYRQLKQLGLLRTLDRAVAAGVAYQNWGLRPYPKDSYPSLQTAMELNYEIALRSASYGLPQMMGFNYEVCGYPSAEALVLDFRDSEVSQLEAMVKFLIANKLADKLKNHDWAGFALGYNGPGFAKNGYDKKLAANFAKWQKIKDTPYPPNP